MGVENEDQFRNREGTIDDSYRIRFISEHLWHTLRAREAGANCQGYSAVGVYRQRIADERL